MNFSMWLSRCRNCLTKIYSKKQKTVLTAVGQIQYIIDSMNQEGWPSGQRQQTVNLPTYVYVGSNPTPSTILVDFVNQ